MDKHRRPQGNGIRSRLLLFIVIPLLLLLSTNLGSYVVPVTPTDPPMTSAPSSSSLTQPSPRQVSPGPPHDPIVISSDADFASQGWPGSGMPGDPYRISNYSIAVTTVGQNCINISNTIVHFVIGQCSLTGSAVLENTSGVVLRNVRNGYLDNNTFFSGTHGMVIENTSSTAFVNNVFAGQRTAAATLIWSDSCILENNTLLDAFDGISLHHSVLCQVVGNNCTGSHYTISLEESNSNKVLNNTCLGAAIGIRVESSSENNTVANNTGIDCYLGMSFSWSNWNEAIHNRFLNSTGGIALEGSQFSQVILNTLTDLAGGGIEAVESDHCQIVLNTLTDLPGGGIEVSVSDYCTIANNTLTQTQEGIHLRWSRSSTIANNSVTKSTYGISLFESNATIAVNNTLFGCGFSVSGDTIGGCRQSALNYNFVNGKSLEYRQDQVGGVVTAGAGQVILVNCTGVVVRDQLLVNCTVGIQLSFCNGSSITNNTCTDNQDGVSLRLSRFNTLSVNVLIHNVKGVFLYRSSNNYITKQVCTDNEIGIRLAWWSSNNTLRNNTCTNCWQGITLEYQSSSNRILMNVLSANVYNAYDTSPDNIFDYNYWSDYWGFDLNQDGIGDIPYIVPPTLTGSFDPHPLMSPPGVPPTFGPREAFWLVAFLSPVVVVALLSGFLFWVYRRRRISQEPIVKRPRTRRQSRM